MVSGAADAGLAWLAVVPGPAGRSGGQDPGAATLERLMAMPLGRLDLLAGYAIAFGLVACVQVAAVLVISLSWLGVSTPGSAVPMAVVAVLDAILDMSLGLFASAFARSEFQAVQFMPAFVLPQALLCGLVVARSQMTPVLRWLSDVLPLSYAVNAMQRITASKSWTRVGGSGESWPGSPAPRGGLELLWLGRAAGRVLTRVYRLPSPHCVHGWWSPSPRSAGTPVSTPCGSIPSPLMRTSLPLTISPSAGGSGRRLTALILDRLLSGRTYPQLARIVRVS